MIALVTIKDKRGVKRFIDFPHKLYEADAHYVPELFVSQQEMLWPGSHPFYEHSSAQLFLVCNGDKIMGRIAAILNNNHNAYTGNKEGFFGFFDCINQQEIADMLLNAASAWLRSKGMENMIGPINLTTNDTCGLLVEGFDCPPVIMMPYNKPYYEHLLVQYGLRKKTDLFAYRVSKATANQKAVKLVGKLEERLQTKGIVIREINMRDFKNEIIKVREVYNKAWDKNLGFVPMTAAEFTHAANSMKLILDHRFCIVAEKEGKLVGFALGIPDINQIQINIKKGRLFPTGIFKLLLNKKRTDTLRVLMLGVIEGYRKMGIEACLYGRIINNAAHTRIRQAECSWMLEDNYLMNHAIEQINGELYKRYRIFEKKL
ncbi:hypothetical protein [Parapedobacter tibetensis]|uniref:hypothetical protein n=1 Tax=Parapedobacter tibetensis TaxID=2972951 RepID=UPI00214D9BDC|nr:hypothetical protein [Parapedobacter tibetensis]